ncbi:MAG: peptidyl-prolyl cis-trans isomerase [Acidobacteriota bacterium]
MTETTEPRRRSALTKKTAALFATALLAALLTAACGDRPSTTEREAPTGEGSLIDADPEIVVARDAMGEITWGLLDARALESGAPRRGPIEGDTADWIAELARQVSLERLLIAEAELIGADRDPELARRERQLQRTALTEAFLADRPLDLDEDRLRALYADLEDRFVRPERRRVVHLFKRWRPGIERADIVAELQSLRKKALEGVSFEQLAASESESEARHSNGVLGFVERGNFSEDFDRVVFALPAETPSDVIETTDGGHLFYVSNILEARSIRFDEARPLLRREAMIQAQLERLEQAANEVPRPEPLAVAPPDLVRRAVASGRRDAVVLEVGDFRLTAGELAAQVATLRRELGGQAPPDLMPRLLAEIRWREMLFQHLRDQPDAPEAPEQVELLRRRQLAESFAERRMRRWLDRRPELIEAHHRAHPLRFATPPRVALTRLAAPLGNRPTQTMARLEDVRTRLDAGTLTLETLAEELGGELDLLDERTPRQLAADEPRAARFATLLEPGEHSPPVRRDDRLVLFRLESRREPTPRPLALAREAVLEDLLAQDGARIFREMRDEVLAEGGFALDDEAIARLLN